MCGETLEEREAGTTDDQGVGPGPGRARPACPHDDLRRCVVAYEPIWAIGTGRNATPDDANATIGDSPRRRSTRCRRAPAAELRILYGGSVKPGNIAELMAMPEIDGGLVGGASLDPDDFARLVRFAR